MTEDLLWTRYAEPAAAVQLDETGNESAVTAVLGRYAIEWKIEVRR
ncbi:hypothetical protein [Nocardia abscessus]|uniref:Uncharacterized protein n=1 Tax=Nocardia abscessus TaxID=120957 RepID=A0ABS0BZX7_9NOCA|nr:hypothetical protein [Nocardia abscessus]MBF6223680.1 hypothetical protein [Nocardia abscessus]